MKKTCIWKESDNGPWETECGEEFDFIDGGIDDNKFQFCPFCGWRIEEIRILLGNLSL